MINIIEEKKKTMVVEVDKGLFAKIKKVEQLMEEDDQKLAYHLFWECIDQEDECK